MKNKLEQAFDNYVDNYDMSVKQIRYKYHHSYYVKDLMIDLAKKLKLSDKEIEVASVIGLLHDIGRFEQVKKYGTCSDSKTGVDHADESCIYLFDEGHIKDFYDDKSYYDIIKDAIKNHNKYSVDSKVKGKNLFFSNMIRDTDKIDIYRVISEEYDIKYNYNEVSEEVIKLFNDKKKMHCEILKNGTDSLYFYLGWLYDLNYKESYKILYDNKNIDAFFNIVIPNKESIEQLEKLKKKMNLFIEEQI